MGNTDADGSEHHHSPGGGGFVAALVPLCLAAAAYFNWKPTGIWTTAFGAILAFAVSAACALWTILVRRYAIVLKAAGLRKNARDRKPYAELRARLEAGGTPAIIYEQLLIEMLAKVDRFFDDGDAGAASRSLWPNAFGLTTKAALWTPTAFDRCLLLALIYPIGVIFILWGITGHQGPAEAALGLPNSTDAWIHTIAASEFAAGLVIGVLLSPEFATSMNIFKKEAWILSGVWKKYYWNNKKWKKPLYCFAILASVSILDIILYDNNLFELNQALLISVCGCAGIMFGVIIGLDHTKISSLSILFYIVAISCSVNVVFSNINDVDFIMQQLILIVPSAVPAYAIVFANYYAKRHGWQGRFQLCVSVTLMVSFVALPFWIAPLKLWQVSGATLLFLGLLTLVNAPFDWFSLGLTRALLRRGLERKGWWPYFYAAVDAALAVIVIAVLAIAMLLTVQTFDDVAEQAGGRQILDLKALFDGLSHRPAEPEYYWIYFTLFSTMIPSVVNLCVGGTALLRGIPFLARMLLRNMPAIGAVARAELVWMPMALAFQVFFGVLIAIVAQAALFFGLLGYLLPIIGLDLLDICSHLAAVDLPEQALRLVVGRKV